MCVCVGVDTGADCVKCALSYHCREEKKIGWAVNVWTYLSVVASAVAQCRLEDVLLELGFLNSQDQEELKKKPNRDEQCSLFLRVLQRRDPENFMNFVDALQSFYPLLQILDLLRLKCNTWQGRSEQFDWKSEEFLGRIKRSSVVIFT